MGGNHFEQLAQEILKQKQRLEKLEAENRELRQQITDLHSGRGIFVDIYGIRFALRDDPSVMQTTSASPVPASSSTSTLTGAPSIPAVSPTQPVMDTPTVEIAEITPKTQKLSTKEQVSQSNNNEDKKSTTEEATFLEEIMIDEFTSALASPNAVWQGPTEKKQSKEQRTQEEPTIDEKQKAILRRELMGSYLLE